MTSEDLDRFIAADRRWQGGHSAPTGLEWRRARLEELLALDALAAEARRDGLLESGSSGTAWLRQRSRLLAEEMERRALERSPQVTDVEVAAYLVDHPEEASAVERLRLRHIFRRLPVRASPEERNAVLLEMETLLSELKSGADFGALARDRSDSQTSSFDGLIAPVRRGELALEVEDVIWGLDVGQISGVVATSSGFHIFRLEERLPPAELPHEEVAQSIRHRLERQSRAEALDVAFGELTARSHALYHPEHLAHDAPAGSAIVFQLDREVLTKADVRVRWQDLDFVTRRTTSLADVLHDMAWERLACWEAAQSGLESDPNVAERLEAAEWWALASAASERRIARYRLKISNDNLVEFQAQHEQRYRRPAERRLRAVIVRFAPKDVPLSVFDRLDALASEIRAADHDLPEVARLESTDPSGADGGDLGWVDAKTLFAWAGGSFANRVLALEVGELSDPLLIEVYEPERLRYRADGYAVVRVEDSRPDSTPPVSEILDQLATDYVESQAPELRHEMRRSLLAEIGATIDETALAAGSSRH